MPLAEWMARTVRAGDGKRAGSTVRGSGAEAFHVPSGGGPCIHTAMGWLVAISATSIALAWFWALPTRGGLPSVDLYFLFYPAYFRFGSELRAGRFPIWNDDLGMGINELADSQFGFLYPPNLLFTVLPTDVGIEVQTWLHMVLASLGVWVLCRREGLSRAACATAATAIASSTQVFYLSNWTTMLATYAWAPLVFAAARSLSRNPGGRSALALAIVLGLQISAGYLQFSLFTIALLPCFLWPSHSVGLRGLREIVPLSMGAVALSFCLAAAGLLPALDAVEGSWRAPENLPRWFYDLHPFDLETYREGIRQSGLGDAPMPYFGVVVFSLGLAGLLSGRVARSFRVRLAVLVSIAFVLSLGARTPLFPLLWDLPFGNTLSNPHKWVYFVGLGLLLLAAVGVDAVGEGLAGARRAFWVAGSLALLVYLPLSPVFQFLGGALLLVLGSGVPAGWLLPCIPMLLLLEVLSGHVDRPTRPVDSVAYFERYADVYEDLRARPPEGRLFVLAPPFSYSPRYGEMVGVSQITTNGTFLSVRLERYMAATRRAFVEGRREDAVALLRAIGSRYVLVGRGPRPGLVKSGFQTVARGRHGRILEDRLARPRAFLAEDVDIVPREQVLERLGEVDAEVGPLVVLESEDGPLTADPGTPGEARVVFSSPDEVRVAVRTDAPGVLVLLDAFSREWHASIAGRLLRQRPANYVGRAVEIPAGEHVVVFRFRPVAFWIGSVVSCLAILVWLFLWRGSARRHSARWTPAAE